MKLHEFEAKKIFSEHGIPVPNGKVASNPEETEEIAREIGKPVMLKSQVLVAGRGKAGGIIKVKNPEGAYTTAKKLFGMKIKGLQVKKLLVEEELKITKELYLSLTVDRSARKYVFLASSEGGMEIEKLAAEKPEKIVKVAINPLVGIKEFQVRKIIQRMGLQEYFKQVRGIIKAFKEIASRYDCELVESNPLVLTEDREIVAADARIIIDDNSLFRHQQFQRRFEEERGEMTQLELTALKEGFSYVDLEGSVGVIANGAGLTMASMDLVAKFGGKPANFLDIGGGASAERVRKAVEIQLRNPKVRGVLVNILGGITRCDEVAKGLIEALEEVKIQKPIIIRMQGTREEEGRKILKEAGISYLDTMEEAAKKIVEVVKGVSD